jgi:acyl-CoA synthetase (AMP-forming)/AMP-acid ligase II
VVAWLAAARIGAVAVPFSTFSTGVELRSLLRNSDVQTVIAAAGYRNHDFVRSLSEAVPEFAPHSAPPLWAETVPSLRRLAFDGSPSLAMTPWSVEALLADGRRIRDGLLSAVEGAVRPSARMAIIHTSGSSAEPKGVIHQHGSLIRHIHILNELREYRADDILFCNSPFFWIGGFAYALLATLEAGGTLVCSNAADAASVLDVIERAQPTMVNGFAQTVAHLADDPSFDRRDLNSIRRGNLYPIMPRSVQPADPELRHNMLGMTEAGSVCLATDDESDQPEHRRGSFGRPVPGLEAKVIDPDTGEVCPAGEVGEICFRGPNFMEGYYGRERHEVFDTDGWFHTGDLAHVDGDGLFYFKGRRSDMIKTSGANVSPREVEAAIMDETGLRAHVVGIDDPGRGQLVAAAICIPPGTTAPDAETLSVQLRRRLSTYKLPRRILLLPDDEVPIMSSGKLDVQALKQRFGTD